MRTDDETISTATLVANKCLYPLASSYLRRKIPVHRDA